MMIPEQKEKRILTLLSRNISTRKIAFNVGVSRETVRAVKNNHKDRAVIRASNRCKLLSLPFKKIKKKGITICPTCKARITILPCVFCHSVDWIGKLTLERLICQEGKRFIYIVKDLIRLDDMRVIHHPLFTDLIRQAREAVALLPIPPGEKFQ